MPWEASSAWLALGALLALVVAVVLGPRLLSAPSVGVIQDLYIYPIKSCAGMRVERAVLSSRGLENDRRYMWVMRRDADGEGTYDFVTQRQLPCLALVRPEIVPQGVLLQADGMESLLVPRLARGDALSQGVLEATLWGDTVQGVDQGDAASEWLVQLLRTLGVHQQHQQCRFRLVYMDAQVIRPVGKPASDDAIVSYADQFPLLVLGTSSLDALNARMPTPLPMNRFRPNIVVRGFPAFDEDTWRDVRAGTDNVALRGDKLCSRCVLTTTDQTTAEQGGVKAEPLATLRAFRTLGTKRVYFGTNMSFLHPASLSHHSLAVGDRFQVVHRGALALK